MKIDLSAKNLHEFCQVLDEFALPRALFDFDKNRFVAWNQRFLERAVCSENEIKTAGPEELLVFGDSWFPLSEEEGERRVEFVSCAARRPFGATLIAGYVVRSHAKIGYVMLDGFDAPSAPFDLGRTVGREEERLRIIKAYHDEISSSMIEALFLLESVKSELQEAGAPQARMVSKAAEILTEATEKMAIALGNAD